MSAQFTLLTDSPCDLAKEFLEEHNVRVLHFTYSETLKDSERPALSGVDDMFSTLDAHSFYEQMRSGATPKTSQPSQGEFDATFRAALADGLPCVYLSFSSGISGCYEGAVAVLDRLKEEKGTDLPFYIVDTKLGSTPETLFVVEAIAQRDRGLTPEQFVAWAEEARYRVHTLFIVDDLGALKRGGRIPTSVAVAGSLLDLKPLLGFGVDGKLEKIGICRGRKKALKKIAQFFKEHHSKTFDQTVVALGNADCPEDSKRVKELILKEIDEDIYFIETTIGPTVGCHVGAGMLAFSFWGGDRREIQDFVG